MSLYKEITWIMTDSRWWVAPILSHILTRRRNTIKSFSSQVIIMQSWCWGFTIFRQNLNATVIRTGSPRTTAWTWCTMSSILSQMGRKWWCHGTRGRCVAWTAAGTGRWRCAVHFQHFLYWLRNFLALFQL